MRRVASNRNPAVDLFGPGKPGFKAGNPQTGEPATTPGFEWFNAIQEEAANVVEGAGLTLAPNDNTQLLASIRLLAGRRVRAVTSNTALAASDHCRCINASGTWTQTFVAAATLGDGWLVEYRNNGTGTITLDPNGSETIDGATTLQLAPGETCCIVCDGTAFYSIGRLTAALQLQSGTAFTSAGTAPAFTLTPVPAIAAYAANQRFRVKFHAGSSAAATLNISAKGAKSIKQYDSTGAKINATIAANQLADVEYDGTDFVILDPLPPVAQQAGIPGARANLKSAPAAPISLTGNTTSGSNQISNVASVAGLIANGTYLTGAGIPAGSYITAITGAGPYTLTLNNNATATATGVSLTAYVLNNRTTSADAITVGDGSGNYKTLTGVSVAANIGASGSGGLDTGTLAASSWYYEHIIYNPTTQAVAKLYSASATAPTLPSGYTMWARGNEVRTDANKILYNTIGADRWNQYVPAVGTNVAVLPQMASGGAGNVTTPTWVAIATGSFIPPTAVAISVLAGTGANAGGQIYVAPSAAYGVGTGSNPAPISTIQSNAAVALGRFLLESTNIYWASNTSTASLNCFGWESNL